MMAVAVVEAIVILLVVIVPGVVIARVTVALQVVTIAY
jgi:hypothetical protein